jgi:hypothetical protein
MLSTLITEFLTLNHNDSQWLGFSSKKGWVVYDRTLSQNTPGSKEILFTELVDNITFRTRRVNWQPPYITCAKNHLSALPKSTMETAFNELLKGFYQWDKAKKKIIFQKKQEQERIEQSKIIEFERIREKIRLATEFRKHEIKKIIKQRNIKYLVHFTQAENIESILKHGLLSRNEALLQEIDVCFSDPFRFDNRTNSINLSIMRPNYSMFYSKRMNIGDDWAVLLISPEVLYENDCEFSSTNAATGCDLSDSTESFSNMFSESVLNNAHREVTRKEIGIPTFCTTDPQAEILVEGAINPNKIMAIAFETLTVKNRQISQIGSFMKTLVEDNFIVEDSLFKKRHDYQHWPSKSSVRNNFSTPELLSFL